MRPSEMSHSGVLTQFRRDALRRETSRIDGRGNATRTEYDAFGRVAATVDALTNVTTFAYDAYGANMNETVIGVAGTNVIERFTDPYGRDAGYALNGVCQTILGYDEQTGRLATMETSTQEVDNHHSTTTTSNYNSFTWTYHPGSDLKSQLAYPNGLTARWTYDANNQLLQVQNATPTNVISQYDYAYDAAGRRVACSRSGDAMTCADTIAYAYNARGELTNALSNVDADYSYSYQYDDIGNRVSSAECGARSAEYVANELNQYTQIDTSTSALPCETFNPEFDDDGNQTLIRTATGDWRVTYNGENRPVLWTCLAASDTIATNADTIAMSYDRMGRRVTKNAERFVYDGYLQIANHRSAPTTSNYNFFTWDPTEPVATRPLTWNSTTHNSQLSTPQPSTFFYTHDGNKNVSEVIDTDTALAAHYEYAPFGSVFVRSGGLDMVNLLCFSGEYYDGILALTQYVYRKYDSSIGGWLSRDAIGERADHCLYRFIGNDPINRTDQFGLMDTEQCQKYADDSLKTSETLQRLADAIKSAGCDMPEVACKCCLPGENGKVLSGYYEPPRWIIFGNEISICANAFGLDMEKADKVEATIFHELIHAFQSCRKKDLESCDGRICGEIQAYYHEFANYEPTFFFLREEDRKRWLKDVVALSADAACKTCYPNDVDRKKHIEQYVEDHLEECKLWTRH